MALRIGGGLPQMEAASDPAMMMDEAPMPEMPLEPVEAPVSDMGGGSVVEWLQEAMDLCNQYQCPEDLAYAIEQALVHLIGPSAVGATEPAIEPEIPAEEPVAEELPAEDEEEI